jgi:hypothetical protein
MKLLLQKILNIFTRNGATNHQKWLPSCRSKINEATTSYPCIYLDRCQTINPKAIDSGSISGKTYNSHFSESSLRSNTDFCKIDLISSDPFFSQVEKTINTVGVEAASKMLGREPISIYMKLLRNRLERLHREEF